MEFDDSLAPVAPLAPVKLVRLLREGRSFNSLRQVSRRKLRKRRGGGSALPAPVDTFEHGAEPDPMEVAVAAYEVAAGHLMQVALGEAAQASLLAEENLPGENAEICLQGTVHSDGLLEGNDDRS